MVDIVLRIWDNFWHVHSAGDVVLQLMTVYSFDLRTWRNSVTVFSFLDTRLRQ